jgi:hypothetical protein
MPLIVICCFVETTLRSTMACSVGLHVAYFLQKVVALSVQCLNTDWTTGRSGFDPRQRQKKSFSLCVQTGSEAHPASCPKGTGGGVFSPRVKRGWGVTLTTDTRLVSRSRMRRRYNPSPPCRLHGDSGTALLFTLHVAYLPTQRSKTYVYAAFIISQR